MPDDTDKIVAKVIAACGRTATAMAMLSRGADLLIRCRRMLKELEHCQIEPSRLEGRTEESFDDAVAELAKILCPLCGEDYHGSASTCSLAVLIRDLGIDWLGQPPDGDDPEEYDDEPTF